MDSFELQLSKRTQEADRIVAKYLPAENGEQKTLLGAMNYSILAGGKRLRPLLMQLSYELFGGKDKSIEPFMAAMEMIHTHSLIHDDLPAMDNDIYRRGRKTTHVVYGEAMAILAGDALLNYAYETALRSLEIRPSGEGILRALQILSAKTGINGMIGGQSVDVEKEGSVLSEDTLAFIHQNKTGALIEASLMIGAALSSGKEEDIRAMEQIGADIGLAFQIRDDLLDVEGESKVLGKSTGNDEKNHKTTYVTLHGTADASAEVERLSTRALERLGQISGEKEFLSSLIRWMIFRDR